MPLKWRSARPLKLNSSSIVSIDRFIDFCTLGSSTYQKSSASAAIKPPDLWIHHDQMELKHLDKSLHSSASKSTHVLYSDSVQRL